MNRGQVKPRHPVPRKTVPIRNEDVARVCDQIADLLEIQKASTSRVPAYRNASREVRGLPRELASLAASGADLTERPGLGETAPRRGPCLDTTPW